LAAGAGEVVAGLVYLETLVFMPQQVLVVLVVEAAAVDLVAAGVGVLSGLAVLAARVVLLVETMAGLVA
jgi:hypothetical protein